MRRKTGKRALVTGAAGFVGRHIVPELLNRGYDVVTNDIRGCDLFDIDMQYDCRSIFSQEWEGQSLDLVVHLAANVGGRAVIDGSPLAVGVNLALDSMMFEWARRATPGRVLYFSSSAAYPVILQRRECQAILSERDIDLTRIRKPDATYGWAKISGEVLADFSRQSGVPVTVVRPFSGYGSDQDLAYPFPSFIQRGMDHDDPFLIWGDGWSSRDWIHIDDVVKAALVLAESGISIPVNLCTGIATTFNRLATMVCDVAGYSPEFTHLLAAPQGVYARVGNPSLLKSFYIPEITLEQGIRQAFEDGLR